MPSQPFVTGPCAVFPGVGTSAALTFLGWSERGVSISFSSAERDVYADPAGPDVPIDTQWMGETATFSMTLTRYHETVLQTVLKRRVGAGVTAGAAEANAIGSLMIAEGYAYPMLLYFPYVTKSFQSTMVPGYLFGAAWLTGNYDFEASTEIKKPRLTFRSIPVFDTANLTYTLYSNTMPGTIPSWD